MKAGIEMMRPFVIETQKLGLRQGTVKLLVDFELSVNGNPIAHTHSSTLTVERE